MKTFCPLPWSHLFVSTSGATKLCCVASKNQSYQGLTNNDSFNKARLKMLKGERPDECYDYCYKVEDNGGFSKRQEQLVEWPNDQFTYQDAVNYTRTDGSIMNKHIYDLDLRIGNTCDLACIMCGSINSSKWAELERSINIKTGMEQPFGISKWWEDKEFWEQLKEILRNAKLIKFGGGEPLLLKQHKELLLFLKENNPNCYIKYITNANNITQEYIDLWQDLPNLKFTLSIDSIAKRVEYLRWPIKWPHLIKNIRMLKQLKTPPTVSINYTITLFNILYVNDDLNWLLPRLNELGITHFHPSHVWDRPFFLHPGLLPDEIKDTIKIDADETIATNINSYLYSRSYDKELVEQFIQYTKQLDSARGTDVLKTFPRLKSIIL